MDLDSDEERVLRLLSETRNREILTVLEDASRALDASELAERIVAREARRDDAGSARDLERVHISLHHHRLPKLDDAGLIEYDRDEAVARRNRGLDGDQVGFDSVEELLDRFRLERDDERIEVLQGRDAAIECGRRLVDEADEELFLMYVTTDLLEAECLRHARDAIERGVDIYLGSRNGEVRDLARERFPEVTVWEPELDWLNAPSSYPTVGRLVLADREQVMFALLDQPPSESASEETAVVGAGEDNPLVVLVRELLGPRLDHLDYQSEHFRSELPF